MTTLISPKKFSGTGHIFDGVLAAAVIGLAQAQARDRLSLVADVTDSSGGTAGATILEVSDYTPALVSGSVGVAKAECETAIGGVRDGLKEIVAKLNTCAALVPAFATLTDSMGGTAVDGTIAAIDVSATGASASLVSATRLNVIMDVLRLRFQQVGYFVNKLAYAAGVPGLGAFDMGNAAANEYSTTFAVVSTDTGATATGADATAANGSILKTAFDAKQVIWADNLAMLALVVNACVDDAADDIAITVVASETSGN